MRGRTAVHPDVVMKFRGVGWNGFQHAKALVVEQPLRITYANGDLLLMSPGAPHGAYVGVLDELVRAVGRAFRIPTCSLRSTLWERRGADAGKEPDASYYVASAIRIENRIPDVDTDPVPDLAIEVEINNPIDLALKAYANLRVAEVWHFAASGPRRAASLRFLCLEHGDLGGMGDEPCVPDAGIGQAPATHRRRRTARRPRPRRPARKLDPHRAATAAATAEVLTLQVGRSSPG